ncbi:MAG TPA: shikimate dehydrogenase [Caulobacteraceae bacterium]
MSRPISGGTMVAAVVGDPVAHSLSPIIHNSWAATAGIDGVYVALRATPGGFSSLVQAMRGGVMRGFNVTAPFKMEALALADTASPRAQRIGAANLLIFHQDGKVSADNTDGTGLLAAFAEQAPGFEPGVGLAIIIGAGGAARAAADALLEAGALTIGIVNRTPERAETLARSLGVRAAVIAADGLGAALSKANVVIDASGGQAGGVLAALLERVPPSAVIMDMTYRPLRTPLLTAAEALGLRTVDGLAMLIGQAAPCFEALFGVSPPAIDVRAPAIAALEPAR